MVFANAPIYHRLTRRLEFICWISMESYKSTSLWFLLFFVSVTLPACTDTVVISGEEQKGQLRDAKTGAPIPDAFVAVSWNEFHQAYSAWYECLNVSVTTTDSNGYYYLPAWKKPYKMSSTLERILYKPHVDKIFVYTYKKGYRWDEKTKGNYGASLYQVNESARARLEFLDYLSRNIGCGAGNYSVEIQKPLLPMLEAIYEEALDIATTKEDDENLFTILSAVETLTLGYDEASERSSARVSAKEHRLQNNPAYRALNSRELADLEYVIQTGLSSPNSHLENGDTLLMTAADKGNALMVRYLLNSGADPTAEGYAHTRGGTALSRAVFRLFNGQFEDPSGYIDIVRMLSAAKGTDLTQLRDLKSNRDPKIRALADITPANANKEPEITKAPVQIFDIFSKPFELKADKEIYLQFEIKDGKIKNVREVAEVPPNGELLSLQFRDGAETGRQSVALRTRMHGKVYMRVVQEGGDQCAQPAQSYLVGTPPFDGVYSWTLEPNCNKVTVTDFHLHNWPNEQPEQPSLSIDVGSPGPVNSTSSTVWSEGVSRTK